MRKNIGSIFFFLLTVYIYAGCDVYREDLIPDPPAVPVSDRTFYTTAQDEVVINLLSRKEYQSATSFRITQQPKYGTARFVQKATLIYTPSAGSPSQSDYWLISITQNNATRTDSLFVRITEEDSIPCKNVKIRPDYVTTPPGVAVSKDVLANDQACQGRLQTASLTIVQQPAHGSATLQNSSIRYIPTLGFTGVDYILYQVCTEAGGCEQGYLKVAVGSYICPNLRFVDDTVFYKRKLLEPDSVYIEGLKIDLFANDMICPDYPGFNVQFTSPGNGTRELIVNNPPQKSKIRYRPRLGFTGTDRFEYFIYNTQVYPPVILAHATVRIQIE